MATDKTRWIARLTPAPGRSVNFLLQQRLSMDVCERDEHTLLVIASKSQLGELVRRRLARIDWISTVSEYEDKAKRQSGPR